MNSKVSRQNGDLIILDPPKLGAKIVGLVFLGFGAVVLVLLAIDTIKKVSGGDLSAIWRSMVSVLIIVVMTGLPGILFGFVANRIQISRDSNQMTLVKDFVVYKHTSNYPCDKYTTAKLKRRSVTSRSKVANSNQYRTRTQYYVDVLLVDGVGKSDLVITFHEKDTAEACYVADEIARYLEIDFTNRDDYCG